jgi:hypothetical protein
VHKTANVLNNLPRKGASSGQERFPRDLAGRDQGDAEKGFGPFEAAYEGKYPKAVECLRRAGVRFIDGIMEEAA